MAKDLLGIDIGAGYLRLAVVSDRNEVRRVAYEPMPENLMSGGRMVSFEAMADFLRESVAKNGINTKECALALGVAEAYVRVVTIPAMTVSQVEVNLPYEFKDYLGADKAKYRYDYAVLNSECDEDGTPKQFTLLAAATKEEIIAQYEAMFKKAGLKLKIATPGIMAFVNAVRLHKEAFPEDTQADFCFVDLGAASTKVHLFPRGSYDMTRSMEFGRQSILKVIAEHFDTTSIVASAYFNENYEDAQTLPECVDMYDHAGVELSRVVNFFNFNYQHSNLQKVYYLGSATNSPALVDAIRGHLSIDFVSVHEFLPESLRPADAAESNMFFPAICVAAR